ALTAEEELRIYGLERGQTLERANVAEGVRAVPVLNGSRGQTGILDEDRALQLLQLATWLEPEFLAQQRAGFLVHGESFCLSSRAVERQHQLRAEMLAIR